jgi:hypothetical protein
VRPTTSPTSCKQDASRLPEANISTSVPRIHEGLVAQDPDNREYKIELAKFSDNLSDRCAAEDFDSAAGTRDRSD